MLVRIGKGQAGEAVEQAGSAAALTRNAGGEAEVEKRRHQGRIGIRGGVVMGVAWAGDEVVGLVRGEAEAAALLAPMMGEKRIGQPARGGEMGGIGGCLV